MATRAATHAIDAHADAAQRLGRALNLGELNVDIVGLDRDLATGKERLYAAVEREKRRALRAHFIRGADVRLRVTPQMVAALRWLYRVGQRHGEREIRDLTGVTVKGGATEKNTVDRLTGKLASLLIDLEQNVHRKIGRLTAQRLALSDRDEDEVSASGPDLQHQVRTFAAQLPIGDIAQQAAAKRVMEMPGALNVASQLVSDATFSGLGSVYDESAGLFSSFIYSAVMDAGTCDPCAELDGQEFETWDAIQDVLPDGGPNPDCDGEGRCRCRAVPGDTGPPGGVTGEEPTQPEPLGAPPPEFAGLPTHAQQEVASLTRDEAAAQIKRLQGNIRGLHWHAKQGKPLNTVKLSAYQQRIDQLRAYIDSGAAPAIAPTAEPFVSGNSVPS